MVWLDSFGQSSLLDFSESGLHDRKVGACILESLNFDFTGHLNMRSGFGTATISQAPPEFWAGYIDTNGTVTQDQMIVCYFTTPKDLSKYNKIHAGTWIVTYDATVAAKDLINILGYTQRLDVGVVTDYFNFATVTQATFPAITNVESITLYHDWGNKAANWPLITADNSANEDNYVDTVFPNGLIYAVTLRFFSNSGLFPSGYRVILKLSSTATSHIMRLEVT